MKPDLKEKVEEWLNWDKNEATHSEIQKLVDGNNEPHLEKVLLSRMEFGTAGLRGRMAAGYACMNDLVIIQTTQGLASYVLETEPDSRERGVVLGFDGRHNSPRFAALATRAFLNIGIPVYLFSKLCPTPFVPFAVLLKKCVAGIMVTASHNPKEDNGYKVYWRNGAQIISPHDKGIQSSIIDNLEPWVDAWAHESVREDPQCFDPLADVMNCYYSVLAEKATFTETMEKTDLRFVYTPVHGVGADYVTAAFETFKLPAYIPVKEQILPDPEFSTVRFPNPEEGKSTLDLSVKTAEANGVRHIVANDPDADRMAFAEKQNSGEWKIFNGNELGALLGWWTFYTYAERKRRLGSEPNWSDHYMIASTVSSKVLKSIGRKEGFHFEETLTGFKWMANRACELMAEDKTVLFAFEEAIGFMVGTEVLDKDGVSAAVVMAELVCFLAAKGQTVNDKLLEVYREYGYHVSINSYYLCYEPPVIEKMFERLRNFEGENTYPRSILNGKYAISSVRDLTTGYDDSQPDKKAVLPVSKSAQMITFSFENGVVLTLRTSGTEPKVKYYTELCAKTGNDDWSALDAELKEMVGAIVEEFLQPVFNGLTPRPEDAS